MQVLEKLSKLPIEASEDGKAYILVNKLASDNAQVQNSADSNGRGIVMLRDSAGGLQVDLVGLQEVPQSIMEKLTGRLQSLSIGDPVQPTEADGAALVVPAKFWLPPETSTEPPTESIPNKPEETFYSNPDKTQVVNRPIPIATPNSEADHTDTKKVHTTVYDVKETNSIEKRPDDSIDDLTQIAATFTSPLAFEDEPVAQMIDANGEMFIPPKLNTSESQSITTRLPMTTQAKRTVGSNSHKMGKKGNQPVQQDESSNSANPTNAFTGIVVLIAILASTL